MRVVDFSDSFTNSAAPTQSSIQMANLSLSAATTTNANDSVKISGSGGAALANDNPGYIVLPSTVTGGYSVLFEVTANVTLLLTGAHWGFGTRGDLTDMILDVIAINDAGTLKWGVQAYPGSALKDVGAGSTNAFTAQTSVTAGEHILVNTALTAGNWPTAPFMFFKASFDDTGGAAEDLWAVNTAVANFQYGSSDGSYRPWNPTFTGFSANPTTSVSRWAMTGKTVSVFYRTNVVGTSNATTFTMTLPVKSKGQHNLMWNTGQDNGVNLTAPGRVQTTAGGTTADMFSTIAAAAWTAANGKAVDFSIFYEAL